MVHISVLGPVAVRSDGALVPVPGGKTSELLVRLALEAGVTVRAERLVEDLWGGDAVNTRPNTLQSKVARLRGALGKPGAVLSGGGGYRLAIEADRVDALAVLREAASASELLAAGDDRAAAELSAAALGRFQGELLPSAGDGVWAAGYRARLDEARAGLIETRCSARLRLGDGPESIGDLEDAVAAYPFREALWELLAAALYRAGRQVDALAACRRVRARLADELGIVPGPRLQELERQILRHDSALAGTRPPPPTPAPGNLPSLPVELVGREAELAALSQLLADRRLVEIVGPGGIGKTALAIAVGRAVTGSPGGVWLARLEAATTAYGVLDAVVSALGLTGGEAVLLDRLAGTTAMVILDNCEHVVDAAASLAGRLLDAAPGVRVLATSQLPLGLDGTTVFELGPLDLDAGVELFSRRAAARREDPRAVRELCRSLDGLPLAIELAAARTRTLSVEDITRRLGDRFSVLSDPASRKPERRRALRATIAWSYDLLSPEDRRGLWALAAFAGGAPLPAVERVLEALDVPAPAAIDVVGRLVNRSLVTVAGGEGPAPVRYHLLESIRAFALAAMGEAGLTERALAAHAGWYGEVAAASTAGVRSSRQAEHLAFARSERANLDAALEWSSVRDPRLALRLVNGFGWAWIVLGDSRGAQRLLTALAAAGEDAPERERASALLLAAWAEASTGHLELAREHIATATALARAIADADLEARCAYHLAYVVSHDGEFGHAMELTDRSSELYGGRERPWDQAANWLFAARAAASAGDRVRAAAACDRVEHWLREVDDPWLHVRRDAMLGELARLEHRFDDAVVHIGRAAETSGRLGFRQTEAYQVWSLGRAQCQAGDYATGAATLERAVDKAEATGDVRLAALARVHLGRVLRALGRAAGARTALEAAAAWHRSAGGGEQAALGESLLAALDAEARDPGAEGRLTALLERARADGDAPAEVVSLDALARIAGDRGDVAVARERRAAADRRMAAASDLITELDRTDLRAGSAR